MTEEVRRSLHFDDVIVGQHHSSATHVVTEADIVRFAHEWDPQSFHLDPLAARDSLFGGLVASGLHTLLISFRLFNDIGLFHTTALAGAGMEGLRWLAPVHPGEVLQVRVEFVNKRAVHRPGRGIVTVRLTTTDQSGSQVLVLDLLILVARQGCRG